MFLVKVLRRALTSQQGFKTWCGNQEPTSVLLRVAQTCGDVGGAQVLATGKSPETEIDFKYAIIGTAVGVVISAGFLALKVCMIRRNLFDNDSSDLRHTPPGFSDTILLKKRAPRLNLNSSKRDEQVIEL
ncbi:transmembrane protein 273 [Cynocephalus volans]|uniref:transmembrane protein 273 n=1 Tax=Cynocephalus volans TaxID=110931 RepID=UPI002FC9E5E0